MEKGGREDKLSEEINMQFHMVSFGKTSRKRCKEIKAEIYKLMRSHLSSE